MVSFQCESCGDVLTKKKLDPHRSRCRGATFSCIDCMVYFNGTDYRSHTSCITEDQKYQGTLYKNKNKKVKLNPPANAEERPFNITTPNNKPAAQMAAAVQQRHVSHNAYVEDVAEDVNEYLVQDNDSDRSDDDDDDAPPHAPTPPPGPEDRVNVFDFLVASAGTTPNMSSMNLTRGPAGPATLADSTQVVSYERAEDHGLVEASASKQPPVAQFEMGPVAVLPTAFQTPAQRSSGDKEVKKDKKRKRLMLDISADAPPVLHSGLTGGLHRLSTKHVPPFPPSPESAETPASPLKKTKAPTKHAKSRSETMSTGLFAALTAKPKSKKRKQRSASPTDKKNKEGHSGHGHRDHHRDHRESRESREHRHHRRHSHHKTEDEKKAALKMIEYPANKEGDSSNSSGQMIVYKPPADLFLSFVNKGPESERGCSMNKALKRFHRERTSSGKTHGKQTEEKELFRSLRLRKNDRGEIVVFYIDP
ncbi:hypothetical protein CMQ_295 [Grosmannia clavigera kw1407]|uniref:Zinc finger C2H2 LYAR-type domain-containing protein n=1 Tax=Grosmannia clavigera (strain kw1407 / UAMH 11150) TaxID=655863 RepID=F0XRK6_GROCL|nr:uncharacterized protein CMQ_295 [Grosmannia clavigera kw1407]EFW99977.1 hypothetical protein CMQ_295 [Grosmannia clavigera kw1407]